MTSVGGEVGGVDGGERGHAELGAEGVELRGDDALQRPERQPPRDAVAEVADVVVARGEPETERRRVA